MIKVVHGDCEWILCRRFKHFRSLHDSLWVERQKAKIPMPTKGYSTLVHRFSHVSVLKMLRCLDFQIFSESYDNKSTRREQSSISGCQQL